ncbi:MAG: hypothetical protein HOY76_42315 [Streptomyces sp.]|nr:hypothetical protein [Streptomyces sp.]
MARTTGPVPKRSTERRRRNKPEGAEVTTVPAAKQDVECPPADESWHQIARDWYDSLARSGQAVFYEPSDWATARYVAEAMSRGLQQSRFSAQLFAAVSSAMTELLTTEGARRRARLEIERGTKDEGKPADVTALDDYRAALGS